jgi:hypothetical protein
VEDGTARARLTRFLASASPLWHNGPSTMRTSHRTTDAFTAAGSYAGHASYASSWRLSAWRFI